MRRQKVLPDPYIRDTFNFLEILHILTLFYTWRGIFAHSPFFVINPFTEKRFLFLINLTLSQNSLQITHKNLNLLR